MVKTNWASFLISVVLHAFGIAVALWLEAQFPADASASRRYHVTMLPKPQTDQKQTLWYDFRAVPKVSPPQPFGSSATPRGDTVDPRQTLIVQSPKPVSKTQLIWQPEKPQEIPADVPMPNVVAVPSPPARPPSKKFIPPPPRTSEAKPPALIDSSVPELSPETGLTQNALVEKLDQQRLAAIRKPPPRRFVDAPKSPSLPPGGRLVEAPSALPPGTALVTDLNGVIIGLNPASSPLGPPPAGSRPAQFGRASEIGEISSGSAAQAGAPKVPGVLAAGNSAAPAAPGSAGEAPASLTPERKLLQEIAFPALNRTMSMPLRPSSRVIPRAVEAQFAARNVYTLVLPGPKLPEYAGDWVIWFAERDAPDTGSVRIIAPVPARKYVSDSTGGTILDAGTSSVLFSAVVDQRGRLASPRILRGPANEAFRRMALAEIRSWEFQPALRNAQPIDVDVVLEVPFKPGASTAPR